MKLSPLIQRETNGQYCINCSASSIEKIVQDAKPAYKCNSCETIAERCIVIDSGITWWVDSEQTYWHESVGLVIVNTDGKILCMFRKLFPFAYTIPAGHLDTGEKPEVAARRELEEETGIKTSLPLELLGEFDINGDSCRRGADDHRWHLYRIQLDTAPEVVLSDEASEAHWLSLEELEKAEPKTYPVEVILKKFGAGLVSSSRVF